MFDYESPIIAEIVNNVNDEILKLCVDTALSEIKTTIGYNIDKEELIKALDYDRNQYKKGYQDGKADYEEMQSQNEKLVNLLRVALNDIDRLINVSCVIKCADIIETNSICFMGGTLQGRNTWIHQKEAEEILKEFQEESDLKLQDSKKGV